MFCAPWVALELVLYRFFRRTYPWRSALISLAVSIPAIAVTLIESAFVSSVLPAVWSFGILTLQGPAVIQSVVYFLCAELAFYGAHFLAHKVRWFWADHAAHHSAKAFHLLIGNRLGWTFVVTGGFWIFTLPFVALGASVTAMVYWMSTILLYQFFIHSELIPKLGWLDLIINTPSNHRVHHASNSQYIDKNFGGITMIFDHLFGTYARESREIKIEYGLPHHQGREEANPMKVAFEEWAAILTDFRKASGQREKLRVFFGPPGAQTPASANDVDTKSNLKRIS